MKGIWDYAAIKWFSKNEAHVINTKYSKFIIKYTWNILTRKTVSALG